MLYLSKLHLSKHHLIKRHLCKLHLSKLHTSKLHLSKVKLPWPGRYLCNALYVNCLGEPPMPKVNIEQLCSERMLVQILFSVSNVIL